MAIEYIITGSTPNDKTGDSLRVGATKINDNFNELDTRTNGSLVSGSDQISGSFVNINGDTMTGDLIISGGLDIADGISSTDYIIFDTTPETAPTTQGTLQWNQDELTLDLIQNGTILQLGQEQQYQVVNKDSVTIEDGMAVMAVGTDGASGNITVELMDGADTSKTTRFLGIATEIMVADAVGKVTTFGKVRGIKTDYIGVGDWGETWKLGDILYISSTIPGVLTNIEPTFPEMAMPVAFIINLHAINGTIHVRVNNLNKHEFVQVNEDRVITADLTISGSIAISGSVPTSATDDGIVNEIRVGQDTGEDYIYVCTAPNTWKRSLLSTW